MPIRKNYDAVFLGVVAVLILVGFFALSSASLGLAARTDKNFYLPLIKQILLGGGVGAILFFLTSRINYRRWRKISIFLFLLSFLITLLVFDSRLGFEYGGAKRWLSLGMFTFQPSELLKFSFVLYLSSWLAQRKKEKQITGFKASFLPFLFIVAFVGLIFYLQPDIDAMGVTAVTAVLLFFLAGGRYSQIGLLLFLGILVFAAFVYFKPDSYLADRTKVFFDSSYDRQGVGYQIDQAKIAMGSGGWTGRGFGQGLAKFNYLPEPTGDSIFAVIGEEFGFLGTSFLVVLFLFFLFKVFIIAVRAPDLFGRLLASGIAILIVVQSFVNMYAVVGLIPLAGLPLIFISQGGSALALTLAEAGIILNISKNSNK